jgi:uncharacterized membrane protein
MVLQEMHHEGPLPAPSDFEHYERIYPGAAEMILDMATQESVHRRYMETKAMSRAHREAVIGQIFGFMIGIGALIATILLGYFGQGAAASIVGGATLVGLVTVFVKGRKTNK